MPNLIVTPEPPELNLDILPPESFDWIKDDNDILLLSLVAGDEVNLGALSEGSTSLMYIIQNDVDEKCSISLDISCVFALPSSEANMTITSFSDIGEMFNLLRIYPENGEFFCTLVSAKTQILNQITGTVLSDPGDPAVLNKPPTVDNALSGYVAQEILPPAPSDGISEYDSTKGYREGSQFNYYGHMFHVTETWMTPEEYPPKDKVRCMTTGTGNFYRYPVPEHLNEENANNYLQIAKIQTYKQGHIYFGGFRNGQQCGGTIRFSVTYDKVAVSLEYTQFTPSMIDGLVFAQTSDGDDWRVYIRSTAAVKNPWDLSVEIQAVGGNQGLVSEDRVDIPALMAWEILPIGSNIVTVEGYHDAGAYRCHNFGDFVSYTSMGGVLGLNVVHPPGVVTEAMQISPRLEDVGKAAIIEFTIQCRVEGGTPDKIPVWVTTEGLVVEQSIIGRVGVRENTQFTVIGMIEVTQIRPDVAIKLHLRVDNHNWSIRDDFLEGNSSISLTVIE